MGLDMNTVVSKLEDLNITDKATRREHIRILQTAHAKETGFQPKACGDMRRSGLIS